MAMIRNQDRTSIVNVQKLQGTSVVISFMVFFFIIVFRGVFVFSDFIEYSVAISTFEISEMT